jgi:RND family efflux transporter MFP subunit
MIARAALLFAIATSALAADLPAKLDWAQRVEIGLPLTGVIDAVHVQPGQTVRKGAPLLSLNQTVFKAGLMEARADIERLTQEVADAKRELARAEELYARTVTSTTELDAAKLRHARSSALLAGAEARVEKARRLLEESEPRAPFDVLVLDRLAEPGMAVAGQCQPTMLLILARADEILAHAEVSPEQAAGIKLGDPAGVNAGGKTIAGKIAAVRAGANGRYRIDAVIPRTDDLLAGMAASLRLP